MKGCVVPTASRMLCANIELSQRRQPGECNTDVHVNNCNPPKTPPPPTADGGSSVAGPRTHGTRNNDVYKRVPCSAPAPPPSPSPSPLSPLFPLAMADNMASGASGSSKDNPVGLIILILFLVLAAVAAVVVVRKGWAKPIATYVSSWIRGGSDASAYIRNGDSARGSSTTAAMTAAGLGAPVNLSAPMGASNYQPPV